MSQESVSIFGTCRDWIRQYFNHAKFHAWKAKHKARHTFTSFNKAKREAQYNEGFHFSSYPNNSVIFLLKQNDRRANSTNEPSIKTYCRQCVRLTMLLCSYEANRDQCTLESLKRFLVCPEEPSYFNILILSKRTLCEKSVVVVGKARSAMYFNKGDHEFYFLLALSGCEWHSILFTLLVSLRALSFSLKNDLIVDVLSAVLIANIPKGDNI